MTSFDTLDAAGDAIVALAQSDGADASSAMEVCEQICRAHAARTDDVEEGKLLLSARRMALPALEKMGTTLLEGRS